MTDSAVVIVIGHRIFIYLKVSQGVARGARMTFCRQSQQKLNKRS